MTSEVNKSIEVLIAEATEAACDSAEYDHADDTLLAIWDAQTAQAKALVAIAEILLAWRLESKEANDASDSD